MRKFNCHGNADETNVSILWSASARVIETDTGTGAHQLIHAAVDEETTKNVSYVPNMLSVKELVDKAKDLLTKIDGKKEGVDFLVPSLLWVY